MYDKKNLIYKVKPRKPSRYTKWVTGRESVTILWKVVENQIFPSCQLYIKIERRKGRRSLPFWKAKEVNFPVLYRYQPSAQAQKSPFSLAFPLKACLMNTWIWPSKFWGPVIFFIFLNYSNITRRLKQKNMENVHTNNLTFSNSSTHTKSWI